MAAPGPNARAEYRLHCQIVDMLTVARLPGVVWFHCPNGARRDQAEAAALKKMGMLAGVSDLCISLPGSRMAFMEIKARAGRLSAEQEWFLSAMERNGHRVAVVRSLDEALSHLAGWGAIRTTRIAA